MMPRTFFASCLAALAAGLAAPATAAVGAVVIAPVQVQFHKDWLADMNGRGSTQRVAAQDAQRIADDMATALRDALAEALRAKGYEVLGALVPGAIVLSANVRDLWVNAPTNRSPSMEKSYVRDAGHATLTLEGRDPASGQVHVENTSRETAGYGRGLALANDVTNRFWFESMFRRWADERVRELNAARP